MNFTLHVLKEYQNNNIFNAKSSLNRDDYLFSFRKLKEEFQNRGHDLNTQDICPSESSVGTLFIDIPKIKLLPKNSFLILQESEVVRADNYEVENHKHFKKIFTWKDSLVDDCKYIKLNFCHHLKKPQNFTKFSQKRLISVVSGNKMSLHPKQLYSARKKAILSLEGLVGNDFAYYGPGWDRFYLSNTKILKAFQKLKLEALLPKCQTSSYEGLLDEKLFGMNAFKFNLCFENAQGISGYITEKIFDCFFASVVPVYWGAPDINLVIPNDCFIDYREFDGVEDLVGYLKDMNESIHEKYLKAAQSFLESQKARQFSGEHFAEVIVSQVVGT